MARRTSTQIGSVLGGLLMGMGAASAAIIDDPKLDIYGMGAAMVGAEIIIGCVVARSFKRASRPASIAFDEGLQMGYDNGWLEGHRSARPVVVPMHERTAR